MHTAHSAKAFKTMQDKQDVPQGGDNETEPSGGDEALTLMRDMAERTRRMESFVGRRFDELSMEVNATAQQMELIEDGLGRKFSDIVGVLGAVSRKSNGMSPANAGVELDAVIQSTEEAANTILDAADKISDRLGADIDWQDPEARARIFQAIENHVQDLRLACTFQDLTGQRISKAIENLRSVEAQLSTTLSALGIPVENKAADGQKAAPDFGQEGAQDMKDAPASQADIDALFD